MNKATSTTARALLNFSDLLNVGTARDEALGALGWDGQFNAERYRTLVAQNAQLQGAVLVLTLRGEFFAKLADGADALAVQRGDDIPGFQAGLFRRRTGIDVANQNSFALGRTEKCAELSAEIFCVNSQPGLPPAEEHVAVPLHGRNVGNFRHAKRESPGCWRHHFHGVTALLGLAKSRADGLHATVAPHAELDASPCGNLMDHAAKLCCAFDALSVYFPHHVIFLKARLCCRTVRNDLSQHHATLGGELQFLGLVRCDFMCFDA